MATALATWTIDPVHSSVEFSLDYMGFSTYRTGFRALEGSLQFDAVRPAAAFRAETAIDRRDFGVTWNAAMDTGGAYLGERVQISLAILASRHE